MRQERFRFSPLSALRRFMAAKEGVVALIVALTALPLMLLTGAAIDLRRVSAARTNLQATADAAALAGVDALRQSGAQNGYYETAAKNYVDAAFEGSSVRPTKNVVKVNDKTVKVTINLKVPMTFMQLAQFREVSINVEATATYGAGDGSPTGFTEIVLALDTTGSMSATTSAAGKSRLDVAKDSAKSLIKKVMEFPNGTSDPSVRVGLVPFAQYVNVGLQNRDADWLTNSRDLTSPGGAQSCSTVYDYDPGPMERVQKTCWLANEQAYDCSYDRQTLINPRNPREVCVTTAPSTSTWRGCVGSTGVSTVNMSPIPGGGTQFVETRFDEWADVYPRSANWVPPKIPAIQDIECTSPLMRLTQNQSDLNTAVDAMSPNGFTYIAPGVLWGWRLLTRGQPFSDAAPSDGAIKSLVLMTDGANTRSPLAPVHDGVNAEQANDITLKVCTNAKAAGIRIYTIGFAAPESVKPLLKACASMPTFYYDAPSAPELERAFNDIGTKMTTMRLIK